MTTPTQRAAWRRDLEHARQRAEDAQYHGDRAGALIAQGDARAIAARLRRAADSDYAERSAAR